MAVFCCVFTVPWFLSPSPLLILSFFIFGLNEVSVGGAQSETEEINVFTGESRKGERLLSEWNSVHLKKNLFFLCQVSLKGIKPLWFKNWYHSKPLKLLMSVHQLVKMLLTKRFWKWFKKLFSLGCWNNVHVVDQAPKWAPAPLQKNK